MLHSWSTQLKLAEPLLLYNTLKISNILIWLLTVSPKKHICLSQLVNDSSIADINHIHINYLGLEMLCDI